MSTAEVNLLNIEDCFTSAPLSESSFRIIPNVVTERINNVIVNTINLPSELSELPYKIKDQAVILDAVGAWKDYEDIDGFIEDIYQKREKSLDRAVDI
ncbi:MAG: hypothetical protein K8F52_11990 [Candidatus Scalindua rubra]|uniref:Uncharacterized protein n=1 Tax=Candidatus Scalindua brodae TaxID=237368 RepID=A0A0B0EQZ3_9BACT|nr:MAG: hypothetical protein SCABRO_01149 [Candidatus Scalindua brodae]MBZ0109377.1 hypothetical protein [Candidatus Scalindua rubra]